MYYKVDTNCILDGQGRAGKPTYMETIAAEKYLIQLDVSCGNVFFGNTVPIQIASSSRPLSLTIPRSEMRLVCIAPLQKTVS